MTITPLIVLLNAPYLGPYKATKISFKKGPKKVKISSYVVIGWKRCAG